VSITDIGEVTRLCSAARLEIPPRFQAVWRSCCGTATESFTLVGLESIQSCEALLGKSFAGIMSKVDGQASRQDVLGDSRSRDIAGLRLLRLEGVSHNELDGISPLETQVDVDEETPFGWSKEERKRCYGSNQRLWYVCLFAILVSVGFLIFAMLANRPKCASEKGRWVVNQDIINHSSSSIRELPPGLQPLQGISVDIQNNMLYSFYTNGARVFEIDIETGKLSNPVKEIQYDFSRDFPKLINLSVTHIGGIDFVSNKGLDEIWLACHGEGLAGEGAVIAVDPYTLKPKKDRVALRMGRNLDWVACRDGVIYAGEFFNVTSIYRADLATLNRLPDLEITFQRDDPLKNAGFQYIQSSSFDLDGQLVMLSDDYVTTIHYVDIKSGRATSEQHLLVGSEVDGLAFAGPHMFVGINRQHSHEQVMGAPQYISIYDFQRV